MASAALQGKRSTLGPNHNYVMDPSGAVIENTNVSLSEISSNTELETNKFNAFSQKINHN